MNPITTGIAIVVAVVGLFYIIGLIRSLTPKHKRK